VSNATLNINGQFYGGWKAVSISRGLGRVAANFELTYTDRWANSNKSRPIRLGDLCEVWVDEFKVITGYIDETTPEYDAKSRTLKVKGRSKTADLVDCALPAADLSGVQFIDQKFPSLATAVAKPFGIEVVDKVGGFSVIRKSVIEQSQTVFEFLEERARAEAVLLNDDADGRLVITRVSNERVTTPLKFGDNILLAKPTFSMRDRFSKYVVAGQQSGWDDVSAEGAAHILGSATDSNVKRYRPTVVQAEDDINIGDAKRRAEWQRNVSYGQSRAITYTVNGWRHAKGIWQPNTQVQVYDPYLGLNNSWLLITDCRYTLGTSGELTEITVKPVEAFDLVAIPLEEDSAW